MYNFCYPLHAHFMLVKSAEVQCRGSLTKTVVWQPLIRAFRAFMDDLTMTTNICPGELVDPEWSGGTDHLGLYELQASEIQIPGAKEGQERREGSNQTPLISENPMKSLGKVFDWSLMDKTSIWATNQELEAWLVAADKSGLPGKFKAWICSHEFLAPLGLQNPNLHHWGFSEEGQHPSATWMKNSRWLLQWVWNTGSWATQRSPRLASSSEQVGSGRQQRQSRWDTACWTGLGSSTKPSAMTAKGDDRRAMIQEEVQASVNEEWASRVVRMRQQGAWTR